MHSLELFHHKKIMIVVAHPDDELLGQGATMNRLISECEVETRVVILGEGITARSDKRDTDEWKQELEIHRQNIHEAAEKIGYGSVGIYDFPDNRFDSVPLLDIIKVVEKEKAEFEPEVVFTHHGGDLNIDHRLTSQAVLTAFRPLKGEKVRTIISFETPSGTEWTSPADPSRFIPDLFVDVSKENLDAKIAAMECYQFEKRQYPHPRSPEALEILARSRGISVGSDYAEAFRLIRMIV